MSNVSDSATEHTVKPTTGKPHARISEPHKRAILAAVVSGSTQVDAAKQFGVHPNTVSAIVKSVRAVQNASVGDWRRKLVDELPAKSVAAIERSVSDQEDVHRAANTALAHLKGIGVLAPDAGSGASVQVFVGQVSGLPAAWQQEYFSSTTTSSDEASNNEITNAETPQVIESKE